MKHKKVSKKKKSMLAKIFSPNPEKIFVASVPLLPAIPVMLYVISNFLIGREGVVGNIFYLTGFISYAFISLFAIPFEGVLEFFGMMQFGGGIFEIGLKGLNFAGIILLQLTYSLIFYSIYSITSYFRFSRKAGYSYGKRG